MEKNFENYDELLGRLKCGNRSTFRDNLDLLAQKFGSFRPLDDLAKLSSENEELMRVVLGLIKEPSSATKLWSLSFHSTRQVGPKAIPQIREEWQENSDSEGIPLLHRCLIDIIEAGFNKEEWQRLMPFIAEQEIPLWNKMLQSETTKFRGLIGWTVGALTKYVSAKTKQSGESLISLLCDVDAMNQMGIVKGLLELGDKSLLQDTVCCLARVACDRSPLDLLFSGSKEIDVNAKDRWGKTALTYAEESGNEKIAELLKKADYSKRV